MKKQQLVMTLLTLIENATDILSYNVPYEVADRVSNSIIGLATVGGIELEDEKHPVTIAIKAMRAKALKLEFSPHLAGTQRPLNDASDGV